MIRQHDWLTFLNTATTSPNDKMGNCLSNSTSSAAVVAGEKHHNEDVKNASAHPSVHQGLLRDRKRDVYEKYVEIQVLGQGSMGHIARVRVREGTEGGSAFHGKRTRSDSVASSSSLFERRKEKVEYALKSIRLDRVSPKFQSELQNEIDILKEMVSVQMCFFDREFCRLGLERDEVQEAHDAHH